MIKNNKLHYLYLITRDDGEKYVGVTVDPKRRKTDHHNGRGSKFLFERNFTMDILLEGSEDYIYGKEQEYIERYEASLNIAIGGNKGPGFIGEYVWTAILKEEDVVKVKHLLLDTNKSYTDIANELSISRDIVVSIGLNKAWRHVLPDLVLPDRAQQELSEETINTILTLRKSGLSYNKIAEQTNVSYGTARNWCIRLGVEVDPNLEKPRNDRKLDMDVVSKILELQKNGLSQREIAKELGIGKTTVARHCKENGVVFTMKSKNTNEEKIQEILSEYAVIKNFKKVADSVGLNVTTVKKYLRERGVI